MFQLKYTPKRTYIRITNPNLPDRNYGYISPKDGQISVKEVLWQLIITSGVDNPYQWESGCGRHGGTNYHIHTFNSVSLRDSIRFIQEVFNSLNISFKNNIEE